jgi:hypothetical protein
MWYNKDIPQTKSNERGHLNAKRSTKQAVYTRVQNHGSRNNEKREVELS